MSKLKWVAGILLVVILIGATNLIDRNNFRRVRDSVVSIYKDRLVAHDILFKVSRLVHEKEIAILTKNQAFFTNENLEVNRQIEQQLAKFKKTKQTKEEGVYFKDLTSKLYEFKKKETSSNLFEPDYSLAAVKSLEEINSNLDQLSKIQKDEGNRQWHISKTALDSIELFTQMEIYLLAFLAIIVQIIILWKTKEEPAYDSED